MKTESLTIGKRVVGYGQPVYIIAEMSGNHNQNFEKAVKIIEAAKAAGADAVKLQTYTPDTITLDVRNEYFQVSGTIWEGKNLYDLYSEAYTPWEWHPKLIRVAEALDIDLFSTPFDHTAVDFLEEMRVPAYKIASFEMVDIPLIQKIAETGKPIIMSTGMASLDEIRDAVTTIETMHNELALLKCVSTYPAMPEEMNLSTIPHMGKTFGVPVGLSDHTLGDVTAIAAVALGACIIEKHLTLSRNEPGPDNAFSMEPEEFKKMVGSIRIAEKAVGKVTYELSEDQRTSRVFRRSLFVTEDIKAGDKISSQNIQSVRPGHGLHTRYYDDVMGMTVNRDVKKGTPLSWDFLVENYKK